jgi:hypothetical protein
MRWRDTVEWRIDSNMNLTMTLTHTVILERQKSLVSLPRYMSFHVNYLRGRIWNRTLRIADSG